MISSFDIGLRNPIPELGEGPSGFGTLLNNVISLLVAMAGMALFVYLLYGGITWTTAGGDKARVESAQKTVTNAIIGIIIMGAAFLLVQIVNTVLGRDLLHILIGS